MARTLVAASPAAGVESDLSQRALVRGLAWAAFLAALAATIALLEPVYLAIATAVAVAGVVVLRWPLVGMGLLLFAIPFGSMAEVLVGTFTVGPTEPLVALLGLSWALRGVAAGRLRVLGGGLLGVVLAMVTLMLLSVSYAGDRGAAIKETLKWLELLVVLMVLLDLVRTRRTASGLLLALFAAASLEALWGAAQVATNAGPEAFALGGSLRAFGNFEQPNPFGGYLSMVLPLAVAVAAAPGTGRGTRLAAGATTALLVLGIALSQSRGAWLGLGVAFVVLSVVWSRRSRLLLVPAGGGLLLLVLMALGRLLPAGLVDRVAQTAEYFGVFDVRTVQLTSENWAVVERMAHWQAAWYMFLDYPWLGVGAGNYPEAYPNYYLNDWLDPLGHAHNYYLNTLAELGVVGLALLLVFLWLVFRRLARGLRDLSPATGGAATPAAATLADEAETRFRRALLAGVLGSLVVFCVHNIFDNLFVHSVNVLLGFVLAIGLLAGSGLPARGLPRRTSPTAANPQPARRGLALRGVAG